MAYKQVIAVRTDIGMSRGKTVAQACHAAIGAYKRADGQAQADWEAEGAKKVAVKIQGEGTVMERFKDAQAAGLPAYIVKDAGHTELDPGTVTALGIGPGTEDAIDVVTKDLDLL